jgi:hypothetical protein
MLPLHLRYAGESGIPGWDFNDGNEHDDDMELFGGSFLSGSGNKRLKSDPTYLWMYVIFTYVLTGLAVYLLVQETNKIIGIRQKYLGTQTSTTDRTIRLSGIPPELRSEDKIKEFIEGLQIGRVDSVTLCRNWQELDMLMEERAKVVRNLERAWTEHLGYKKRSRDSNTLPLIRSRQRSASVSSRADTERSQLLENENGRPHISSQAEARPQTRIWYGPFKLRFRNIDAIDYYEEKLRRLDDKIMAARQKEFPPTALAFVTMESISSCQMVVQAILDPHPMQLLATLAPAPGDVVWKNTYTSRSRRMMQSWLITLVIGFLTVFWSVLLVPLASLLELETLHKVFPSLADALSRHPVAKSLVQTGLPTLTLSLLTVAVPYLYSCMYTCDHEWTKLLTYGTRAFQSSRNDVSRRHGAVGHLEEFLLYIL